LPSEVRLLGAVTLEPADGHLDVGTPLSSISVRGQESPAPFHIEGVLPGRYLVSDRFGAIRLEGAEWRGRDLLTTPLEITGESNITGVVVRLTSKTTTISGTVRDATGAPVTGGAVVFFPPDPFSWRQTGFSAARFRTAPISRTGTFSTTLLLPGQYQPRLISARDVAGWQDTEYLASVAPSALKIRVSAGSSTVQDLRLVRSRQRDRADSRPDGR